MFSIVSELRRLRAIAACALLTVSSVALAPPASAQNQPPAQGQGQTPAPGQDQTPAHEQTPLSEEQLEQIVAPIALYPDNLLAQVLTASTYPLEVVMAARWTKQNPNVKGDALDQAMQKQPWDPSVKGLTSVPQVLAMMSEQLDWMEQLGEAFLVQPDDISKTIQKLRAKAEATGNLKTSKELKVTKVKAPPPPAGAPGPAVVVEEPEYIEIEPAEPDVVYVPVYDPVVVYGGWPYPAYRPFYWRPPGYVYAGVFGFGAAFIVGPALWTHYDWRHRRVWIDARRYNRFNHTRFATGRPLTWQHNPRHRGSVPYKNVKLRQEFGKGKVGPGVIKGVGNIKGPGAPKGVTTPKGRNTAIGTGTPKGTTNLKGTGTPKGTAKVKGTGAPKGTGTPKGAGNRNQTIKRSGGGQGANAVRGGGNVRNVGGGRGRPAHGGGGNKNKKN